MAAGVRLSWGMMSVGVTLLIGSIGVTSLLLFSPPPSRIDEAPLPADLETVCMGHVDVASGIVSLYPAQTGRVISISAIEGKLVPQGTELLRLDDTFAALRVEAAQAALAAARVQLSQAQLAPQQHLDQLRQLELRIEAKQNEINAAQAQLRKALELRKLNQITEDDVKAGRENVAALEKAVEAERNGLEQLRRINPEAKVRLAMIEVNAAETKLLEAKQALAEYRLIAPRSGRVLRTLAKVGDLYGPTSPQPAFQFCPDEPLIVRAEVEQENAARLRIGMRASIQDDAVAVGEWSGRVTHIGDWITRRRSILFEPGQMNDVRTLECLVEVTGGDRPLRIGQRVRVLLHKDKTEPNRQGS